MSNAEKRINVARIQNVILDELDRTKRHLIRIEEKISEMKALIRDNPAFEEFPELEAIPASHDEAQEMLDAIRPGGEMPRDANGQPYIPRHNYY